MNLHSDPITGLDGVTPFSVVVIASPWNIFIFRQRPGGTDSFLTIEAVLLTAVTLAYSCPFHQQ